MATADPDRSSSLHDRHRARRRPDRPGPPLRARRRRRRPRPGAGPTARRRTSPPSATSASPTGSCPGSNSGPASSTWPTTTAVPLLERVKFLAIFSERLDEFFQVRVAGLEDQVAAGLRTRSVDGLRPGEQLRAIRARVTELVARQARIFLDRLVPALAEAGIRLSDWSSLDDDDRDYLVDVFQRQIFPVLTPLSVDPGHPFPYISNLSLNLHRAGGRPRAPARSGSPGSRSRPLLPRFVVMPDGERFVPLEQVIAAHLATLFPGHDHRRALRLPGHPQRRPRARGGRGRRPAGGGRDGAAPPALRAGRAPRGRRRHASPTTARHAGRTSSTWRPTDVYEVDAPLDLGGLWAVYALDRPDLHEEAWAPMTPPRLANAGNEPADLFAVLRERDVLVHHPYDSFTTSVEAFIAQAAADPDVLGHQADALPHLGRQPDRGVAHPGGRGGQAGGGRGGAEGPLRRAGQHRAGPGPWRRPASTSSTAWSG